MLGSTFSGGWFHCLINPAPAYCSSSVHGTCPTASTLCGNCDLARSGTVVACSDKCPGCTLPVSCPPGKGSTARASASSSAKVVPIQPTYWAWINSQSLLDMWQLRTLPSYAPATPQPAVVLARGTLDGK